MRKVIKFEVENEWLNENYRLTANGKRRANEELAQSITSNSNLEKGTSGGVSQ